MLKDIALSGHRSYSRPDFLFSKDDLKTLDDLKKDKNIVIVKPDKGNGVVILDRGDYNRKMEDILRDTTKFERLHVDPVKLTLQRENQIKNLLASLKKSESITQATYKQLYPTGSRIGILYGLPKIHKNSIPLRPILSCINNYSYKIAKFFVPILSPICSSAFMVRDSFSFVQELLSLDFNSDNLAMASFDVTSLFTNIPLDETIEIIADRLFSNAIRFHDLTRSEFKQLLNCAVKNCHFLFNGSLYQQIDGVAMGSPLGPLFALSCINNYSYKIAKFFVPILSPICSSAFMVRDSFSFVQELLSLDFNSDNLAMASFDVTSLFTNIPLDETIEIIADRLFSNAIRFHDLTRSEFKQLLNCAVKNCHFLFNGSLYQQIDGVAMGSPLGPLFANIFLSFHETSWLNNCPSNFKPLLYRRYVDDTFLLFRSRDHIPLFLAYLNRQHPNINFTCEVESNCQLSFLDITITRTNGHFETSVYRKPTFTGLFTNFHSFTPLQFKRGLIYSLLHRFFNICSSYENFHAQIEFFRKILNQNGYPTRLFDHCVRLFLDQTFQPKELIHSVSRKVVYFCLPYTGTHSLQIRTQIQRLCSVAYPHISIRIVFRPTLRLSNFFMFKDKIPLALRSCVVYSFKCRCCSASYVGQTVRHLHTRVSEHLGISALTGKTSSSPQLTSIFSHLSHSGHSASLDDFKILSSCSAPDELLVRESLLISKLKPTLNQQGSSIPLSLL